MKVYHSIKNFKEKNHSSILTIGTFDGVHIGHQKIIERLNELKSEGKNKSVILTFFPHPRKILNFGNDFKMLNTIDEKIQLLNKFGLNYLVIEPFTKEFSRLTALKFVRDILVKKLNIAKLVIGHDHQFGKNREGNFEQLQEYGKLYGFNVEKISAQEIENVSVSSTKIRKAIENGKIEKANTYLGYHYLLSGKIVKGKGLGRKLNYPTINLLIKENYKLIPKTGVYIIKTLINNTVVYGIMNIGYRPTIDGKHQTIEIHLLDFSADLYGNKIQIEVLKRLRNEQKFDSLESLIQQIQKDEEQARKLISNGKIYF
ncbi:MAG: bifunctional riboflavin kinase/FAD synthetase [Flavobacteriaceae bacterium]|nr:bifunctional riboflavin kinase/FAD synthetase [Flavobacteriaceae bacterium]